MSTRYGVPPRRKAQRRSTQPHRPPADGLCPTTGKKRWSRREARQLVKRLRAMGDRRGALLSSYRCDECHAWHAGHRPKWAA